MSQCIVYTRPDGGVSIVRPAPEYLARFASESEGLAAVRAKAVPADAMDVSVVDSATVPTSRRFRNALTMQGGVVTHNMPKARVLRMVEIRAERDRRLVASDGPMLRTQETGTPSEIAAMIAYRQALRDIPQTANLNSVVTVEALSAYEPAWPTEPV